MFIIRPGIYTVPAINKRIDTRKELSNEQLLELYECPRFSFITITKDAIPFLKNQKYKTPQLAKLILRAKTADEVNWLLDVKTNKTLQNIAETKIKSLLV